MSAEASGTATLQSRKNFSPSRPSDPGRGCPGRWRSPPPSGRSRGVCIWRRVMWWFKGYAGGAGLTVGRDDLNPVDDLKPVDDLPALMTSRNSIIP